MGNAVRVGVTVGEGLPVNVIEGVGVSVIVAVGEREMVGGDVGNGVRDMEGVPVVLVLGVLVAVGLEVLLGTKTLSTQGRATPDWAATGTVA